MDIQEVIDELTAFRKIVCTCDYDAIESCDDCVQQEACWKFDNERVAKMLNAALDILRDVKEKEN